MSAGETADLDGLSYARSLLAYLSRFGARPETQSDSVSTHFHEADFRRASAGIRAIEQIQADADELRAQIRGLAVVREDLGRRLGEAEASARLASQQRSALFAAGQGCSNVCYNVAQGSGRIDDRTRDAMREAARDWDDAVDAARAQPAPAAPAGEPAP